MMFAEQLLGIRPLHEVLTWYLPSGIFRSIMLLILFLVPVVDGWHPWEQQSYRENQLFCKEISPVGQNLITPLRRIDALKLVLEKTLESPLDSKEIKPVSPKGNQP